MKHSVRPELTSLTYCICFRYKMTTKKFNSFVCLFVCYLSLSVSALTFGTDDSNHENQAVK